jgi:hypothetical protein
MHATHTLDPKFSKRTLVVAPATLQRQCSASHTAVQFSEKPTKKNMLERVHLLKRQHLSQLSVLCGGRHATDAAE